jgi:prephenate dehydrogenase
MEFRSVCILGVGLMGGSVGLACRVVSQGLQVVGFSNRPDELARAIERGAISRSTTDAAKAVDGADLVILCTPVGLFEHLLRTIVPVLKPGAVVTDIGSTKRAVTAMAGKLLPASVHFVGSHPMVGGEKHGIENARADLFKNALCIVTPDASTNAVALARVEQFWQSLGMRIERMTPLTHDRLTSDISHVPHVIAAALVRIQSAESLKLAANGFRDSTRIAAGDAELWRDILLENRDHVRDGILRLREELDDLLGFLNRGDHAAVQQWLATAAETRGKL